MLFLTFLRADSESIRMSVGVVCARLRDLSNFLRKAVFFAASASAIYSLSIDNKAIEYFYLRDI